ncbi:MAG TPA: hypothetical protein VF452_00925 [Candidatus Binatia bacterium]
MEVKTKLLELSGGNYLIEITAGVVDVERLQQIFRKVVAIRQSLVNCKVLIDLAEARLRLERSDIDELVNRLGADLLRSKITIAVVSSTQDDLDRLSALSTSLCSLGLKVAAFHDPKSAVIWLVDIT